MKTTPQQKAEELSELFMMNNTRDGERDGIKCAIIHCDEVLQITESDVYEYYKQVKQNLLNLQK